MQASTDAHARALVDRLDRLPIWPYSYALLVLIGAGFFFSFFDITAVGLALPVFSQQFHISAQQASWTITSSLIGYVIGAVLDGWLSDRLGRRLALLLSVVFFSVGSLLSASSQDLSQLVIWRFITGLGIGAEIANVVTYMGELSPAHMRGKISATCVACAMAGFSCVPFVALALVPHFTWGWRVLFVLGGLGALLVLWMRWSMPESIRWLVRQQQHHLAHEQIIELEKRVKARVPAMEYKVLAQPTVQTGSSHFVVRVALFAAIWAVYYLGNYAWLTLSTKLFTLAGFDLTHSILLVALTSVGFVLGALLAVGVGDRFERKWLAIWVNIIWTAVLLIIGWFARFKLIVVFGFIAASCIGFTIPVMYTLTAEQFPTGVRATCVSITDGLGHIGGAFCGQYTFAFYALFKPLPVGFSVSFSALALTGAITVVLLCFARQKTSLGLEQ